MSVSIRKLSFSCGTLNNTLLWRSMCVAVECNTMNNFTFLLPYFLFNSNEVIESHGLSLPHQCLYKTMKVHCCFLPSFWLFRDTSSWTHSQPLLLLAPVFWWWSGQWWHQRQSKLQGSRGEPEQQWTGWQLSALVLDLLLNAGHSCGISAVKAFISHEWNCIVESVP